MRDQVRAPHVRWPTTERIRRICALSLAVRWAGLLRWNGAAGPGPLAPWSALPPAAAIPVTWCMAWSEAQRLAIAA